MNGNGYGCDMKATLVNDVSHLDGTEWVGETKFDGVRAKASFDSTSTRIFNPQGEDITFRYPELIVEEPNGQIELDGEIIIGNGTKTDFQRLQKRMNLMDRRKIGHLSQKEPVVFVAFDLLTLAGEDMSGKTLAERKELLTENMHTRHIFSNPRYRVLGHLFLADIPESVFEKVRLAGYEGIMVKHIDSRYEHGKRSKQWLKYKFRFDVDCVIMGHTRGTGWRERDDLFGALILGMYDKGQLREVGKVGTGFTEGEIRRIKGTLTETGRIETRGNEYITWVVPEKVVKIRCLDVTRDGNLRQPSLIGLRDDKPPTECVIGVY